MREPKLWKNANFLLFNSLVFSIFSLSNITFLADFFFFFADKAFHRESDRMGK